MDGHQRICIFHFLNGRTTGQDNSAGRLYDWVLLCWMIVQVQVTILDRYLSRKGSLRTGETSTTHLMSYQYTILFNRVYRIKESVVSFTRILKFRATVTSSGFHRWTKQAESWIGREFCRILAVTEAFQLVKITIEGHDFLARRQTNRQGMALLVNSKW